MKSHVRERGGENVSGKVANGGELWYNNDIVLASINESKINRGLRETYLI